MKISTAITIYKQNEAAILFSVIIICAKGEIGVDYQHSRIRWGGQQFEIPMAL